MKLRDRRLSRKGDRQSKFRQFATDYGEKQHAIPQGIGTEVVEEAGDELRHVGDDQGPTGQEAPHQETKAQDSVTVPKPAPRKRKVPSKKG